MSSDRDPDRLPRGAFMERHVGHLLRRAYARARQNSAAALAALGDVSPVQAAALAALMDGPLTQADLSRRIDMEPANTHGLVKRLAAAGLVATRPDAANRRLSLVALTGEGEALAAKLEAALAAAAGVTLGGLSEAERETFVGLLGRVVRD